MRVDAIHTRYPNTLLYYYSSHCRSVLFSFRLVWRISKSGLRGSPGHHLRGQKGRNWSPPSCLLVDRTALFTSKPSSGITPSSSLLLRRLSRRTPEGPLCGTVATIRQSPARGVRLWRFECCAESEFPQGTLPRDSVIHSRPRLSPKHPSGRRAS